MEVPVQQERRPVMIQYLAPSPQQAVVAAALIRCQQIPQSTMAEMAVLVAAARAATRLALMELVVLATPRP
jgi:hypothetical protein